LEEAQYRGSQSPSHYQKKYEYVDAKVHGFNYKTNNIKQKVDRSSSIMTVTASANISPAHYKPMDSFRKT
jgi:hypothetical protein